MHIETDYSPVDTILIAYPEGFKNEFENLVPFYDKLITKIPFELSIIVLVNNRSTREKLKVKFRHRSIEIIVVDEWNDIWVRDIMGIGVNHSVVKPFYDVTYCNYLSKNRNLLKINASAEEIIKSVFNKGLIRIPITIDGGNIILNSKYAFITRKIFNDNTGLNEEEIVTMLSEKLGVTPIIVPTNEDDSLGHIDGYMSFLNDETVAIVEYPKTEVFKNDNQYSSVLNKYCQELNLRVVTIQDRPVNQIIPCECDLKCQKKFCSYSANGNYINFLRLNNTIILPEYTLPTLKETMYYNNVNEEVLSNLGFQVIKINCDLLGQHGGSLRCLSYTCKSV